MVMTNRDRVDRGMGYLATGLGPFVHKQMAAAFPAEKDWVQRLAARNPSRSGAGQRYSLADPRFLLRVITEEWRVFKESLSWVEQGFAAELRDAGNRWAHGDQFSAEDTYRTLDTMERLLAAAGAAEQAGQVRGLRLDLQQPETGGTASSADRDAARPQQPAPRHPGHPARFWSPVEPADVVRAIEEYDRLGQDRFLAEHGFGRATAYLLIYRGRSYDSKAILGVAYKLATDVRIGPHEFSGGTSGAAGVLCRLGFEVRDMRTAAAQRAAGRAGPGATVAPHAPAAPAEGGAPGPAASLDGIDPERSLLVLTCSARVAPLHRYLLSARPARASPCGRHGPCRDHQRRVRHRPRRGTDRLVRQDPPAHRVASRTAGIGSDQRSPPLRRAHRRGVRPSHHRLRQAAPPHPLAAGRH